ncbi:MAG: hypothetical protein ACOX8U_04220 [Bradymonadia bacterium]
MAFPFVSCKKDDAKPKSGAQAMGKAYPKTAEESMQRLAPRVNSDVDLAVFVASYGVLTEIIEAVKAWGIVSGDEMDAVFNDLGVHYQLNPARLDSYVKAGFRADGGLMLGSYKGSMLLLFEVDDATAFRQFWDTFINEEYGRPRYHEEKVGGVNFVQINVLKRDACTLALVDDLVFLFAGPAMLRGGADSLPVAKAYFEQTAKETLADNPEFVKAKNMLGGRQIVIFASAASALKRVVGEQYTAMVDSLFESLSVGLNFEESRLALRSVAKTKSGSAVDFSAFSAAAFDAERARSILAGEPESSLRISFDSAKLEEMLLKMLPATVNSKWQGVKEKLEQRLLNIRLQSQILDNFAGSLWFNIYGLNAEQMRGAKSLSDALPAISAALFVPFSDPELSDVFFSKVNALRRLIPPERLNVENVDGILIASTPISPTLKLNLAYYHGLLAVFTDLGLEEVKSAVLGSKSLQNSQGYENLLSTENNLALKIRVQNVVQYLSVKYEIISVQLATFLAPLQEIEASAKFADGTLSLEAELRIGE